MSNSNLLGHCQSRQGFHKWVRMPIDDLPLIRPPKRHMLAQMTGGLKELYTHVKKSRSRPGSTQKESPLQNSLKRAMAGNDGFDRKFKGDDFMYSKESKSFKLDDEHERRKLIFENEESSLYTDEEGEFVPSQDMPLLAHRYKYVNVLARGQSALIIKALDTFATNKPIAIKVLHRVYKPIGSQEADILIELDRADPWCHVPFSRLKNQFIYGPHYCLVFESLSPVPLYTHYKQKNIKGMESIQQVQNLCIKLLSVLGFLHKQNVIHADFKPENILLKDENDMNSVTVIDFGNSLRNTEEELSLYYSDFELQTLLYRAPEVIFGLKFSLQIDLWSLGCLLAECFIGQPLFIGKTKHDMLSKITKLLGPFPKQFSEGACAHNFREFLGTPLSQYQRVDNLKKKLNCTNINFLLLLEQLLAYSPQIRANPFEAASHSFVAEINPFLYLSSAGEKSYPSILLNSQTYPHLPNTQYNNSKDDKKFVESRMRLAKYSNRLQNNVKNTSTLHDTKQEHNSSKEALSPIENKSKAFLPTKKELHSIQNKKESLDIHSQFDKKRYLDRNDCHNDNFKPKEMESNFPHSFKETPVKSPEEHHCERQSISSPEMPPSSECFVKSPLNPIPIFNNALKVVPAQIHPMNNSSLEITKKSNQLGEKNSEPSPTGDVSRTDVKQTLKSMGLRCEDFTISVYSREQAHAILRKQGVEVTNHNQIKLNMPKPVTRLPKINPDINPSVSVMRRDQQSKLHQQLPQKPPANHGDDDDDGEADLEDDDDCVILDPPEGPKKQPVPPASQQRRPPPHQFQLMGTTVQVGRNPKRAFRGLPNRIPAKRGRPSYYNYLNDCRATAEDNSEASVQDTLNRLKNYNISITCKKNTPQGSLTKSYYKDDHRSDNSDSHSDDDEEADFSKFLECEIKEKGLDDSNDKDKMNYEETHEKNDEARDEESNEETVGGNHLEKNDSQDSSPANNKENNIESFQTKDKDGENDAKDEGECNTNYSSMLTDSKKDGDASSSVDDDDINEELEKQLLESSNFDKDLDDVQDDGLDSLEKEL